MVYHVDKAATPTDNRDSSSSSPSTQCRSDVQNNNELQCKIKAHILTLVDGMYVRLYDVSPWPDILTASQVPPCTTLHHLA